MSLSSHLQSKRSPVRVWLEESFPRTRTLTTEANRQICGDEETCLIPCPKDSDPGLVGGGVDYLLRACLRVSSLDPMGIAATKGVRGLSMRDPQMGEIAFQREREALRRIRKLKPSTRELSDSDWTELSALCLVLARFEQNYRSGGHPSVLERLLQPLRDSRDLDSFISLTLTEPSIRDLANLGRLAWEDHAHLRRVRDMQLDPDFALSSALGGADADLIVRKRLIDWKSTSPRRVVTRERLWQLIGYALADTRDQYGLQEVGINALRWRSSIHWSLEGLLTRLAIGGTAKTHAALGRVHEIKVVNLPELRAEFAHVVKESDEAERVRFKRWTLPGAAKSKAPPRSG